MTCSSAGPVHHVAPGWVAETAGWRFTLVPGDGQAQMPRAGSLRAGSSLGFTAWSLHFFASGLLT